MTKLVAEPISPIGGWKITNCHEPKVSYGRQSCPICWGNGEWLGYSDREWAMTGGRKPPSTLFKCPNCCGRGHVKHYPSHVKAKEL